MKKLLLALLFVTTLSAFAAEQLLKIPFKQDPPISVDGDLADWRDAKCGAITLNGKKNLLKYGNIKNSPAEKDFSGKLYFCWKPEGLYFAADVIDDKFMQIYSGEKSYFGDHIELFIDTVPREKAEGSNFGKKQFHLLVSPGNFKNLKPEIFAAHPEGHKITGSLCAAAATKTGWTLEAFIPWKSLGQKNIKTNDLIALTAWLCDTDAYVGDTPKNKQIFTIGAADAKFRDRSGLIPAVFTDSNGKFSAVIPLRVIKVADKLSIKPSDKIDVTVTIPEISTYLVPVLRFNGNMLSKFQFSGYARSLQIYVNGKILPPQRMYTPENEFRTKNGSIDFIYANGKGYLLPYTNDGKSGNVAKNTLRFFASHFNMHKFSFDLSGMLKAGKNVITFKSTHSKKLTHNLEIVEPQISFEAVPRKQVRRPAPTGTLQVIVPKTPAPLTEKLKITGSTQIVANFKEGTYKIDSRYSTPDGKWVKGSNKYFKFGRHIERKGELLIVNDYFTNLTKENLPIMQEHSVKVPGKNSHLRLSGIEYTAGKNVLRTIGNFSVFGGTPGQGGVGLYALNPEFQVHFGAFIPAPHTVTMCDDQFVIPPGKKYTQRFIVVPLENGGYYDFVNAVRRHLKINKTIPGVNGSSSNAKWMKPFLPRLNTYHIDYVLIDGQGIGRSFLYPEPNKRAKETIAQMRKIRPGIKVLRYFHSQIESDYKNPWKGGELLLKNGRQARYGSQSLLYLNLEGTPYNKFMESVLDDSLKNWDIDGIYWDEFASSSLEFHYGEPWDNCSADINPKTHKIDRLKASVWLIQYPWKRRMVDKILKAGKILTANGGDALMGGFDKDMLFTFTETQYASNCARVHFSTPLAHANHEHMDRNKSTEYYDKFMENLEYGGLPAYSFISQPHTGAIYPTITDHAFPCTPIEIHAGYVIGKERIVTKKSGRYGWLDNSKHTIYVYDHTGREVKKHNMKTTNINGKTYSDIRLAEGWSAVIVRNK